jgi:drug/metabolite transporter (DMT)-like permease
MSQRTLWTLALVAVTAVWGWSFVAKHALLATMSASALNAWMFCLAAMMLVPFSARSFRHLQRRDWLGGLLAGTVLFAAFTLQTSGVALTTPSNAGFITGLCTVFTPMIVFLLGRAKPGHKQVAGTLIALAGLGFLSLDGFSLHFGDLLMLGCAVAFALHIVVVSSITTAATASASACLQLSIVGALSLAWSLTQNQFALPGSMPVTATIVALALFGTALAYAIQTRAQVALPAEKVALILICEPLFSGVFGYFLAGDRFPPAKLAGAVLILLGILLTELRWSSRQRQPNLSPPPL